MRYKCREWETAGDLESLHEKCYLKLGIICTIQDPTVVLVVNVKISNKDTLLPVTVKGCRTSLNCTLLLGVHYTHLCYGWEWWVDTDSHVLYRPCPGIATCGPHGFCQPPLLAFFRDCHLTRLFFFFVLIVLDQCPILPKKKKVQERK